jgi:DNA-binding NtrC family response regulator
MPNNSSCAPNLEFELHRLAPSRVTVLLLGGTSTSRYAAAQVLHERSPRAGQPFVAFDCLGHDADSVELALFGGPVYAPTCVGAFHEAAGGTAYVATIDRLPLLLQARFLRFLDQECSVRVIVSSDMELLFRVREGCFRLDLAERLSLIELMLPTVHESV